MPQTNGRRTSRRDIYRKLRQMVLSLELAPGAALSENELAASLGVSRTPVRESLILLSQEGLVQVFPKIGSFVSRVDPAQVADAQFLREAVELASLEDLPERLDAEIVAELRE
ncbi:GntR family transcriptional regulator, partial [Streptomyces sp. TRM76130]|nr:GntR family transcriptional regulator [Streptomyces sp. TRM76130]